MSAIRYYLSLIPQGLIASMLPPEQFGSYYALGSSTHARGEALFFEVDAQAIPAGEFPLELAAQRCVPRADGSPKRSVYLAIYRVLSRIPVRALGHLYLTTRDGQTLGLDRGPYSHDADHPAHLYQQFCPIDPMVVSNLAPLEFCRRITDPREPVHVPRIVFSQLSLGELARDPISGSAHDLPYPDIHYLRDIVAELLATTDKSSKLFHRQANDGVHYRTIRDGFYVGDQDDFAFYPFPSTDTLSNQHHSWWRSAQSG